LAIDCPATRSSTGSDHKVIPYHIWFCDPAGGYTGTGGCRMKGFPWWFRVVRS
jgi:hypothetical protein